MYSVEGALGAAQDCMARIIPEINSRGQSSPRFPPRSQAATAIGRGQL